MKKDIYTKEQLDEMFSDKSSSIYDRASYPIRHASLLMDTIQKEMCGEQYYNMLCSADSPSGGTKKHRLTEKDVELAEKTLAKAQAFYEEIQEIKKILKERGLD